MAPPAWSGLGSQRRQVVVNSQGAMSNMRIIANLCISSLFDRFPRLKVASVESGIGWIPFFMEFLEFLYDEMITADDERAFARHRPTDYFREHLYVMFWFEEVTVERSNSMPWVLTTFWSKRTYRIPFRSIPTRSNTSPRCSRGTTRTSFVVSCRTTRCSSIVFLFPTPMEGARTYWPARMVTGISPKVYHKKGGIDRHSTS